MDTRTRCATCRGSGTVEATLGGDGYGNRCAGTMDGETECFDCGGSGRHEPECGCEDCIRGEIHDAQDRADDRDD